MASLNGVIEWWEEQKETKEAADVMRLIADEETTQRVRTLRQQEKDNDAWLAAAAGVLDDLEDQHRELDKVYAAAMEQIKTSRRELLEEAARLKILPTRIEEYRKNSLLLQRIVGITDYTSAANFLEEVPGVDEIGSCTYEEALEEGKRITAERKKERDGEQFDERVARRMIPVLLRCGYTEEGCYTERFFLALHDSFARKVVQDVKERLRQIYPSFGDRVADMQTKATTENVRDFFFAEKGESVIMVARAHLWSSNDRKRKYAVLLERRPGMEELEVLDAASAGDGPDELVGFVGKTFRYRVNEVEGVVYPELRHLRDNVSALYRFVMKVLRDSGWEVPERWPAIRFPQNWKK